jgi:hypothetical protein
MEKFGSGINIPDPQHWYKLISWVDGFHQLFMCNVIKYSENQFTFQMLEHFSPMSDGKLHSNNGIFCLIFMGGHATV